MEIIPLTEYQIGELERMYLGYVIENIGIIKESGVLVVQYIDNGVMKTKKINRKP